MFRKLLTLLALCAGLLAGAEPARAAVGPAESVQLVERAGLAATATRAVRLSLLEQRRHWIVEPEAAPADAWIAPAAPTVRLNVERSRE